jgi:alpha-L-rhamnosidase
MDPMEEPRRISVPTTVDAADANIRRRYAIETAAWIWHPRCRDGETAVLDFANEFEIAKPTEILLHVTADQRYELFLDDRFLSRGPDRSDLSHWSFASYRLTIPSGRHALRARVVWLGGRRPYAQITRRGGFLLKAEGLDTLLDTGLGGWRVARVGGIRLEDPTDHLVYHVIGPGYILDGAFSGEPEPAVEPAVVDAPAWRENPCGEARPGWRLQPSSLPDQLARSVRPGRFRAAYEGTDPVVPAESGGDLEAWSPLLRGEAVTVPPHRTVQVIWDLDDYFCGYSRMTVSGGAGSEISWEWSEALYEDRPDEPFRHKGNRNEIAGKIYHGFGDRFRPGGRARESFGSLWWRAGRYVRLRVSTANEPLRIEDARIEEVRYPLECASSFRAEPGGLEAIVPLAVRGMQMCSHETFMDCPYYEQLMYVGDTRLEALTWYAMTADPRLPMRAVELFDWSRWQTGFVAERYPSDPYQLSLTFSMLWVSMLRDFATWREADECWLRDRLTGARCLLEHFAGLPKDGGLLCGIPGWPFVDWVPHWSFGMPPEAEFGVSSPVNLLYAQALLHAAEVEDLCGDARMAGRWREDARGVAEKVFERFWDEGRGLLADDPARTRFSEHAQCLALINGLLDEPHRARCIDGLLTADDLARTTVYFRFYLFEALQLAGRGDRIVEELTFWRDLVQAGFKTPVETPEPSRSDCHAWGSHPLFHFHATLAGIRPDAPGFRRVRIAPCPGPLRRIESRLPHPRGTIAAALAFDEDGVLRADIDLPPGTPGVLTWAGREIALMPGAQRVQATP